MNSQTMPASVGDERVLERLEAEFLRTAGFRPHAPAISAGTARMMAPAVGRIDEIRSFAAMSNKSKSVCCR